MVATKPPGVSLRRTSPMPDRQRGFTLVELMIVVGIIGVLASVAIPTFQGYKMRARQGEVDTVLTQMARAGIAYYETEFADADAGGELRTGCRIAFCQGPIPDAELAGSLGQPRVVDFDSQVGCTAIGFSMPEPIRGYYNINGLHGDANGKCGALAEGETLYVLSAGYNMDQDSDFGIDASWIRMNDGQPTTRQRWQRRHEPFDISMFGTVSFLDGSGPLDGF